MRARPRAVSVAAESPELGCVLRKSMYVQVWTLSQLTDNYGLWLDKMQTTAGWHREDSGELSLKRKFWTELPVFKAFSLKPS